MFVFISKYKKNWIVFTLSVYGDDGIFFSVSSESRPIRADSKLPKTYCSLHPFYHLFRYFEFLFYLIHETMLTWCTVQCVQSHGLVSQKILYIYILCCKKKAIHIHNNRIKSERKCRFHCPVPGYAWDLIIEAPNLFFGIDTVTRTVVGRTRMRSCWFLWSFHCMPF